jgi:glycosyltransferase involved in cell wall biosynthesis
MPVAVKPTAPVRPNNQGKTILYWFGSKATMPYLQELVAPLEELGKLRNDITLRVVGHGGFSLSHMKTDFVQWTPETETQGLAETDIGLCPMPNTPWTQGKCPYKVLCYMANAMPWVGSAVGENIHTAGPADRPDQTRGFVAENKDQWVQAILKLVDNPGLRQTMGHRSHAYILEHHERSRLVVQQAQAWRKIVGKARAKSG